MVMVTLEGFVELEMLHVLPNVNSVVIAYNAESRLEMIPILLGSHGLNPLRGRHYLVVVQQ